MTTTRFLRGVGFAATMFLAPAGCTDSALEGSDARPPEPDPHHDHPSFDEERAAWDEVHGPMLRATFGRQLEAPDAGADGWSGGVRQSRGRGKIDAGPPGSGRARGGSDDADAGIAEEPDAGLAEADAGPADGGILEPDGGLLEADAGVSEPDAGLLDDSGVLDPDAGVLEPDAGVTEMDAGAAEMDAGVAEMDAGIAEMDAGVAEMDAGAAEMDAGVAEMDAGVAEMDAGLLDPDSGPLADDAGATEPDGGATIDGGVDAGTATLGLPVDRCVGGFVPDQLFSGEVALTFDDGPNPSTTPSVIATLRAHGAPATFFIQGNRVADSTGQAIVDELIADPDFIVANHTMTHPSTPYLDELPVDEAAWELDGAEAILRARGETHRYFRFPYSRARCNTMEMVRERGLSPVGVSVDSADWCYGNSPVGNCYWDAIPPEYHEGGMIDFVLAQLAATGGGIVLMHDIQPYTAAQLDTLLTEMESAGYRFVRLDDTSVFPRLNEERFLGDACRNDDDCTFDPQTYCHRAGFCTRTCSLTCPDRYGWAPTYCGEDLGIGVCMTMPSELNRHCLDLPNTEANVVRRYDETGATTEFAVACRPAI